jgi:NitT/TauT family transport system substrate-binding protein
VKKTSLLFAFFLFISLLSGCAPKPVVYSDLITVKVTMSEQISYAPIRIAVAEGYFAEYGIQVEYIQFQGSSQALALLVSGDADVYAGTLNAGFLNTVALSNGTIKAVADRGHLEPGGCTYQAILIRKDLFESGAVTGPADLRGQIFSTTTAGPSAYLLSTYLSQGGLTFDDIEIKDLDTASEIDGYATGAISGSMAPEPNLSMILESGNAVILAPAQDVLGTFQSGLLAFGQNLLIDNPEVGARFLAGYLKGLEQYNQGKTERNLQIISEAIGMTTDELNKICWVAMSNDGMLDYSSVDAFQQWSIAQEQLDAPVTEEQFWDPSFLAAAQALVNP